LGLSILAFVVILTAESIRIRTGERPLAIAWSASGIVLAAVVVLRWWTVDEGRFETAVQAPHPLPDRPLPFRLSAALGATSFVFSDALIGHMVFVNPETPLVFLISPTYVLAIILLSQAALLWPEVLVAEEGAPAPVSPGE